MKTTIQFLLVSAVLFACNQVNPTAENTSLIVPGDEEALRNLKSVLWPKAYEEQDTVLLDGILHENFELIDDNGDVYSKAYEMAYVANYGPTYSEFEFQVERLDLFDNGTAMISGKGIMKGLNDDGSVYITTYKSSNVLIKVDGNWKAINSHVSGVKEETFEAAPN